MIHSVDQIIAHVSAYFSLRIGDYIFTGTPEGVAQVHPGDIITTSFAGIGDMTVAVRSSKS